MTGTPPGYFAFHDIRMVRGRELLASDTVAHDMAIVIEASLAHDLWGSVDPTGRRLEVTSKRDDQSQRMAVVVGVVADTIRKGQRELP